MKKFAQERPTVFMLSIVCLIYLLINLRWVFSYRVGSAVDIDEAGYLTIAIRNFHALRDGGIIAWVRSIEGPSIFSPITTAAASLLFMLDEPSIWLGLLVPIGAGLVTIIATYSVASMIMSRSLALLSAGLIASCPVIIDYARSFHFALPATAVTTLAIYSLIRSDHLHSIKWSIFFGVFVGLMPLTRTMTVSFVPGLALGSVLWALSTPNSKVRSSCNILLSGVVAIVVAISWLYVNFDGVFGYLTSYGYGSKASEYGPSAAAARIVTSIQTDLLYIHLPHYLIIVAGGLCFAVIAVNTIFRSPRVAMSSALASPITPMVIFILQAFAILATSSNKGTAFSAPVVPSAIVVSVWAIFVPEWDRGFKRIARVLTSLVIVLGTIPSIDKWQVLSEPHSVAIPVLGSVVVTSGMAPIDVYTSYFHNFQAVPDKSTMDSATSSMWAQTSGLINQELVKVAKPNQLIMLGFRGLLLNSNTLLLANANANAQPLFISAIDPVPVGDTYEAYSDWLTKSWVSAACFLLTSAGEDGEILPAVNTTELERAALASGFSKMDPRWIMPNGRQIFLWSRLCH